MFDSQSRTIPSGFDDDGLFGNLEARRYLKERINAREGRSVLLHGPSGCGKSLLASLYAKAFVCEDPDERPCGRCRACEMCDDGRHPNVQIFEHDGEDEGFARKINAKAQTESLGEGRFVTVLDRPELISRRGLELLRDRMGRLSPKVIFICCIENIQQIVPAVADMFYRLRVHRPNANDGARYLAWLCEKNEVTAEYGAILRLAEGARSYRHLSLLLERCAVDGELTDHGVSNLFRGNRAATEYLRAVFTRCPLSTQMDILDRCNESPEITIDAIGSRLAKLLRGVLGDGTDCSLEADELLTELTRLLQNSTRGFVKELARVWHPVSPANELVLQFKVLEFHRLIQALDTRDATRIDVVLDDWVQNDKRIEQLAGRLQKHSGPASRTVPAITKGAYFSKKEVRKLWNSASYMVQRYGSLFSTTLTINHSALQPSTSITQSEIIRDLVRQLRMRFDDPAKSGEFTLHWIYRHRTDAAGNQLTEFILNLDATNADRVHNWLRERFFKKRIKGELAGDALLFNFDGKSTIESHRALVRQMCAAFAADDKGPQLMSLLGIQRKQVIDLGAQFCKRRIGISHGLDRNSQHDAKIDLRVIDAFKQLGSSTPDNWEVEEFRYRQHCRLVRETNERTIREAPLSEQRLQTFKAKWRMEEPLRNAGRPANVNKNNL